MSLTVLSRANCDSIPDSVTYDRATILLLTEKLLEGEACAELNESLLTERDAARNLVDLLTEKIEIKEFLITLNDEELVTVQKLVELSDAEIKALSKDLRRHRREKTGLTIVSAVVGGGIVKLLRL